MANREYVNMEVVAKEIKKALAKIGISGHGMYRFIAKECKITDSAVGNWFSKKRRKLPTLNALIIISNLTDTPLDQLIKGEWRKGTIPVVSHKDLPTFLKMMEFENQDNIEEVEKIEKQIPIKSFSKEIRIDDDNFFGLINPDESMTQQGSYNYYPPNSYLIFKADKHPPKHQDLVLVKITSQGNEYLMFRQYLENAGNPYFLAFNPSFENVVHFDSFEIVGYLAYQVIFNPNFLSSQPTD